MRYGVILAIFVVFGAVACQKATGDEKAQENKPPEYKKFKDDSEVPRIALADAKKDYDAGTVVVVDSRPEGAYKQEHITGAINIPIGSTNDKFDAIPKGKKIIVYCS